MPWLPRLSIVLCAGSLLGGCGGSPDEPGRARPSAPKVTPLERSPLDLPATVPVKPTGPADPAQARVIRAWSAALRAGDVAAATALWAVPSKVQNGTPVLELSTRAHVRVFNGSLPCGSVVTATGGAGHGFTITRFRLTRRKGARCDAAAGATARSAIRVRDGKIVEWYRLPDGSRAASADGIESTTV